MIKSYPMRVYIEVSKNHNMSVSEVIRRKFDPDIKLLIMYYNYIIRLEQKEIEKMKKESEKTNMSGVELNGR